MPLYSDKKKKEEYDGINVENLMTLERLKQNQRKDYLKVSCCHYMHVTICACLSCGI